MCVLIIIANTTNICNSWIGMCTAVLLRDSKPHHPTAVRYAEFPLLSCIVVMMIISAIMGRQHLRLPAPGTHAHTDTVVR